MTNGERAPLHELYSRVCEKRPEAAIALLSSNSTGWFYGHDDSRIVDDVASAIILQHWLGLLSRGSRLANSDEHDGTWSVVWMTADTEDATCFDSSGWHSTPLEALAAYLEAQP